jgi:uncharacterized protein (TIGR03067 family)
MFSLSCLIFPKIPAQQIAEPPVVGGQGGQRGHSMSQAKGGSMRPVFALMLFAALTTTTGCTSRAAPTSGSPPVTANDPQEQALLQGTWQVIAIVASAKPVPAASVHKINLQYVFAGDQVTIHRPDRPDISGRFTLDATSKPKKLTIHQTPPIGAIYAIEGKELRLCLMVDENPNAGYPTPLLSQESPKTDLLTLEHS